MIHDYIFLFLTIGHQQNCLFRSSITPIFGGIAPRSLEASADSNASAPEIVLQVANPNHPKMEH